MERQGFSFCKGYTRTSSYFCDGGLNNFKIKYHIIIVPGFDLPQPPDGSGGWGGNAMMLISKRIRSLPFGEM
jgi:hypothetical protein